MIHKKISLLFGQIFLHAKAAGFCVFFSLITSALLFAVSSHVSPIKIDVEFLIVDSGSALNSAELERLKGSIASLGADYGGRCEEGRPAGNSVHYTFCRFSETSPDKAYDQFAALAEDLAESGLSVSNLSFEDSTELVFPFWILLLYSFLHLPVIWFALRDVSLREDLCRAANEIAVRPWWLLVPVVVGVLVSSIVYAFLVFSLGPVLDAATESIQQELIAQESETNLPTLLPVFFLNAIVLAPIWEEAVFRGWLFARRAQELRLVVRAAINGWFFAGAHSIPYLWALIVVKDVTNFSPVPFISWGVYLITVFFLGMLFYVVRDRKNSVSLVIVLHLVQNLFSFSVLLYILPGS